MQCWTSKALKKWQFDTMPDPRLLDATPTELPLLQAALEQLSAELGDPHRIDDMTLKSAISEPYPACHGVLALGDEDALMGAALFSPTVSTTTGSSGAYVSDLWVAEFARGQALGQKLLGHVAGRAQELWQARFIRLVSYARNKQARAFYRKLGFAEKPNELVLQLSGDVLDQLDG